MQYSIIKNIITAEAIEQEFPVSDRALTHIALHRQEIKNILAGTDHRLLMIVGPCSAWPNVAVLDYAQRLLALNEKVKNVIKLVMRTYIQKSRTISGWAGPATQPNPFAMSDIAAGMRYTRDMMVRIVDMGIPIASELLFTQNTYGFLELLSWAGIGARSTTDPEHRIFASAINCAVGMKNPIYGPVITGVNSVIVAQQSHITTLGESEVETYGNRYAHLVLRGSDGAPNYHVKHLEEVLLYMDGRVHHPAVIIDASHDNCLVNGKRDHRVQPDVIFRTLSNINDKYALKNLVKGFMLESFIKDGNQSIVGNEPHELNLNGLSITDPCLGWEDTERFILQLASMRS